MKKQITFGLLFFLLVSLLPADMLAQKKVKGLPEAFKRPMDLFESPNAVKKQWRTTANKDKNVPWIVISDRDENPVYDGKSTSSGIVRQVQFRDLFYVVDEDEDWVKIAEASGVSKLKSKNIQSIGWIPKDRLLLWTAGLIDYRTKINKKAFLLNKAGDIARVLEKKMDYRELIVDFYKDPGAQHKDIERTIYDYYFVFKKENGMYLIGEEAQLSAYNIQSKLLGWVDGRNVEEWNTRISLEPNFADEAFRERKANSSMQFRAFGENSDVKNFIDNGDQSGVYWDNDPVKFEASEMAKSDPHRFRGSVVRFPMFKKGNLGNVDYFRSGVIGSIKVLNDKDGKLAIESEIEEQYMAEIIEKTTRRLDNKNNNVNLFFVIEGTDKTYAFQQDIVQAVRSLSRNEMVRKATNVNYGALVFRDMPEGSRITEYMKLTPDINRVSNFIAQADFSNKVDQDDFTAFYYGIKQSLKVAGFSNKDDGINIMVLIGSCGDYSKDEDRKQYAESKNHESLILDKNAIFKNLADIEAHLFSIQLYNDGRLYTGRAYAIQSQRMIMDAAKYTYNDNINKENTRKILSHHEDLEYLEPTMELPIDKKQVKLTGSKPGRVIKPLKNQSLKGETLLEGLNDMVIESMKYEKTLRDLFAATYNSGEKLDVRKWSKDGGIDVAGLSSGVVSVLENAMENSKISDMVLPSTGMKLSLYTEVYIPVQTKGSSYPSCSYVLFMPESDLLQYQALINNNMSKIGNSGAYPDKRKSLYEMYMALINQFAGEDILKGRNAEDLTRSEVMKVMQGIYAEGLQLDIPLDIRIGDIRNEKKVSNQKIDELIQRFSDVNVELEKIIKLTDRFDFCMVSDNSNRYYWLRMDQVF